MTTPSGYDDYGRPQALHRLVTVCPVAHWQTSKELAAAFHESTNVNGMLNIPLLDNNTDELVGYICFRDAWTDDKDRQLAALLQRHAEGYQFVADKEYTLADTREAILSTFCTIVAADADVLQHLNAYCGEVIT